jgi:hypothetical protein
MHNALARIYMFASDIERQEQEQVGHPVRQFTLRLMPRYNWEAIHQNLPTGMHRSRFQTPEERLQHFNQTYGEIDQVYIFLVL